MAQLTFVVLSSRKELREALEASGHVEVLAAFSEPERLVPAVGSLRPDGLLVDLSCDAPAIFEALERLPSPRPLLLVSGPEEDGRAILRALRLGAREYLTPSRDEEEAVLRSAVDRLLAEGPASPTQSGGRAAVVAVMGAKGGVGTTFLACQLATALARPGARVALVDLNLRLGDVALYFDLQAHYSIAQLASGDSRLDSAYLQTVLVPHASGVRVLAAPAQAEEAELVRASHVEQAVAVLREDFDWVVLDVSRSWDEPSVRALDLADQILLVTIPDVPTLTHARQHLDLLQRLGHAADRVRVIGNRVDRRAPVSGRELTEFLGRGLDERVPNDYPSALACVNEGKPVFEAAPRSPLCQVLAKLAERMHGWCEVEPPEQAPGRRGLGDLFRRSRHGADRST
jgi:pilus assembly protein CpaE